MKTFGLIVAGLALVVVLNVLVARSDHRMARTEHFTERMSVTKSIVSTQ